MNGEVKNRSELKEIFGKNKIVKEGDFASLIDAMPNMADDGLYKSSDNPLEIGVGGDADKTAIKFYSKDDAGESKWSIKLNNNVESNEGSEIKSGFAIVDTSDTARIFISEEDKKIGVNKDNPEEDLDISGVAKADGLRVPGLIKTPNKNIFNDPLKIREDGGATWVGGQLSTQGDLNVQGNINLNGKIHSGAWQLAEFTKIVDGKHVDSSWRHFVDVYDSPTDHARASFFKDPMGFVHLRGLISDVHGSVATRIEDVSVIFILPEGYRPQHHESFRVISRTEKTLNGHQGWGDGTRIDVAQNGEVKMVVGDSNWLSLAGITFYAAP